MTTATAQPATLDIHFTINLTTKNPTLGPRARATRAHAWSRSCIVGVGRAKTLKDDAVLTNPLSTSLSLTHSTMLISNLELRESISLSHTFIFNYFGPYLSNFYTFLPSAHRFRVFDSVELSKSVHIHLFILYYGAISFVFM